MRGVAELIAFLLEVFMIGALSFAGFHLPESLPYKFIFGLGLPLLVMVFWWLYMAPKALHRLKNPPYLVAKGVIYFITALLLFLIRQQGVAIIFAVITVLDEAILLR